MVEIFYKDSGKVLTSDNVDILQELGIDDVLWIDLVSPAGEEKRSVESFLDTSLQSRLQAEEIESSSRYSESEMAIFANTNFLIPGPDSYSMEAVSFVLSEGVLVTIRDVSLRSFVDIQRKLVTQHRMYPTGYHLMVGILENRIDMDADMIEIMAKDIAQYSKRVSLGEDVNEEFILEINQLQENTMIVRENVVDKQRMISSILKSDKFPRDVYTKLNVLMKDVGSLINHANFSFERLEFLQNTVLGLISLDQNKIMKTFTFVSLLFMPATVIASLFGMNVELPMHGGVVDFWVITVVIVLFIILVFVYFRYKKML